MFDLCQEGKILYLVMEYVEGLSLQALVARHGPLDVATACHYARQVAFGLQHAHAMGFVHRDIKPANLLLDRTGVVKVLDLGLVRSEADAGTMLTKQLDNKSILGTADYVAPEQAVDSSKVDARADIYSLGATLYFLLAGRPLFPEGRTAQKLMWQQIKEPVPVARLRPEVPPGLAAVVHRMLHKRVAERFQTVTDVFEALAPFDAEDVPPPNPAWMPEPPARVAALRAAAPALARRGSGATSHIVVAAMRTGGSSAALRKEFDASDSAKVVVSPHTPSGRGSPAPTEARHADDTERTAADRPPAPHTGPTTLLVTLSIALVLALLGIVILLLRK